MVLRIGSAKNRYAEGAYAPSATSQPLFLQVYRKITTRTKIPPVTNWLAVKGGSLQSLPDLEKLRVFISYVYSKGL
jgi:hypothetical protein